MIEELSIDSMHKVKLIQDINDLLLRYGQEMLTVTDFDTLYALEIDELRDAKVNIKTQLKTLLPLDRKLKAK